MKKVLLILLLPIAILAPLMSLATADADAPVTVNIVGYLTDQYKQNIPEAEISLEANGQKYHSDVPLRTASADGNFMASFSVPASEWQNLTAGHYQSLTAQITAVSFESFSTRPAPENIFTEPNGTVLVDISAVAMQRHFGPAFYIALLVFFLTIAFIVFERLNRTTVSLLGAAFILVISYTAGHFDQSWQVLTLERAVHYVDLEVIFLLIGMMTIVGILEETGVFQWCAFAAYRASKGKPWLLVLLLMAVTAILSALLDNVTTVLLVSPITIEIALQLGLNPLALLMADILACNLGGAATLVGDPPNILIGSYAGLTFNDFLANTAPPSLAALLMAAVYIIIHYRKELLHSASKRSAALEEQLRQNARITKPKVLVRSLVVFFITLAGFVIGSALNAPPAVPALLGAAILLAWVQPDMSHALAKVDWPTLVFFIGLFIQVGALEEVGAISLVAAASTQLIGSNLLVAVLFIFGITLVFSALANNIPATAAMLPVVAYIATSAFANGQSEILYWAVSLGACFGANATLMGTSANLVVAGYAERAGYRFSYSDYLKIGVPVTLLTALLAALWLLIIM